MDSSETTVRAVCNADHCPEMVAATCTSDVDTTLDAKSAPKRAVLQRMIKEADRGGS